jgi:hypothetical protein
VRDYGCDVIRGWVYEWNLRPFLEALAGEVRYELEDDDWTGIKFALFARGPQEDAVATRLDCGLPGSPEIALQLLREHATSVVEFELASTPDIESRADAIANVMARYRVESTD